MFNIIIFGAPGSGKGTESKLLVEKYGLTHISTGDVLRAEIAKGTPLGITAKGFIEHGQLIPDDLMIETLATVYDALDKRHTRGVIFDGFPRTIPQADALKKMLAERGDSINMMIELIVPEWMLIKRLINRGIETGRTDDNEETIQKRLQVYRTHTEPLIEYYKKEGLYNGAEDEGVLEEVFGKVCAIINQHI